MITVLSLSPAIDKIYVIDSFRAGELYRVNNCIQSAGGKGINVARVSRMLEAEVAVLGFKAGNTGQWLEDNILKTGAKSYLIEVEGQSRTNNNIIDKVNNRETEILEEGPTISDYSWQSFLESFNKNIKQTKVLVCSGGLPKGLGADTYANLIDEANKLGIKTILDASGDVLKQGINAKPYLIKPNLRELSTYYKSHFTTDSEILKACREIINIGVKVVVTSLGAEGALLVSENAAYKAYPVNVNVINTIGSGDSMVAGISTGLAKGLGLEECFRLGVACASSNTEFLEIGLINNERVEQLRKDIVIERI
ncbi:1-phosphofructokinase family hexose kinase [Ruminiclostridium herbifermentans]|uniref:Tagatose-6-phosphate kinase n=1 Tax=Ruminiclostridium herbifermentans TaxID=2488810 RepID=A0A4U7JHM5_9FIRM|nr:1-phosphofructokinase family hexose kinase [Ruminiclostridium herbifermentans]QNU67557.1 1-phosphofructokinase family hexose kinase [Ruminiclostridium herbifermentans]